MMYEKIQSELWGVFYLTLQLQENYMAEQTFTPDPKTQINVLKRYLHVIALLQYIPDADSTSGKPENWNAAKLADLMALDEGGEGPSDKVVRDYIKSKIEEEIGLDVSRERGGRTQTMDVDIDDDLQLDLARLYTSFVVNDSGRDIILKKLISKHKNKALWMMGRLYFSILQRKMIQVDYVTGTGYKINKWKLCPYYLLFRSNNLYLVAWDNKQERHFPLVLNRIVSISVTDSDYSQHKIVPVDELFSDSLSAYIGDEKDQVTMKIRYHEKVAQTIDDIISILEPETSEEGGWFISEFQIRDYLYLCKQFLLYGNMVEILSPEKVRAEMKDMLRESLSVYE